MVHAYDAYEVHEDWDDEEEDEKDGLESTEDFRQAITARKAEFNKEVSGNVSSINDIVKISIHRDYRASGEFADPIPDNDIDLCEFASRVKSTSGKEREKALDDMLAYIRTSSPERCGENFGQGYSDIRCAWDGDRKKLLRYPIQKNR